MGAAAQTDDDVAYLLYFVWSSSYLIPQDFHISELCLPNEEAVLCPICTNCCCSFL